MAFLQQGGVYGQICITCKASQADSDDRGSTSKGLRIDERARRFAELEQIKQAKERTELSTEDFEKKDKIAAEKKQKQDFTNLAEKKHRDYIDIKKALTTPGATDDAIKKSIQERQKRKNADSAQIIGHEQNQEKTQQQKQIAEKDRMNVDIDFTAPFIRSIALGSDPNFLRMKGILGSRAPAVRLFEQAFGQKGIPTATATPSTTQQPAQQQKPPNKTTEWTKTFEQLYRSTVTTTETARKTAQQTNEPTEKGNTTIEQIEKSFGPSSMKR